MKISKTVAGALVAAGVLVFGGSLYAVTDYRAEAENIRSHSEYHRRLKEIEENLPKMQQEVAECMPSTRSLPAPECLDLKLRYDSMVNEKTEILDNPAYIYLEAKVREHLGANYAVETVYVLSLATMIAGAVAYTRRKDEVELQNVLELDLALKALEVKALEELKKLEKEESDVLVSRRDLEALEKGEDPFKL